MKISNSYKLSEFLDWTRRKLYVVLVLATVPVALYQLLAQVSDIVSSEATAILGGYPQRERDAMRDVLRGYTDQIIHGAWPRGFVPAYPRPAHARRSNRQQGSTGAQAGPLTDG